MDINTKIRVVHLSTYSGGGAGRAACRLNEGLRSLGYDSSVFISTGQEGEAVRCFKRSTRLANNLLFALRRRWINRDLGQYQSSRPKGAEYFSDDRSPYGGQLTDQLSTCTVINLHWIAGFVDYRSFFRYIRKDIPIVWTLHDMNPFTGGCHYDNGCQKHREQCGACPQLGSSDPKDLAYRVWLRKRKALDCLSPECLHIVAPSRWLAAECECSSLLARFPVAVIPNSVDTDLFAPRDRTFSRQLLGIPERSEVIFFIAQSIENKRKGASLLAEALASLTNRKNLLVVSVGEGKPILRSAIPVLHLGRVNDELLLSIIYSAADISVIPSIQEAFGLTAIESLACGTPVVGFDAGGIPDIVRPRITGMLSPVGDIENLQCMILKLLDDDCLRMEMAENCRRIALEEYSLKIQASVYARLYSQLLGIDYTDAA